MLQRMLLVNRVKTHVAVGWTRESGFCLCCLSYKPGRSRSSSRSWRSEVVLRQLGLFPATTPDV